MRHRISPRARHFRSLAAFLSVLRIIRIPGPVTSGAVISGAVILGAFMFGSIMYRSCERTDRGDVTGVVELYFLESFETPEGSCQIDGSTVLLDQKPLIKYADFLSYDPEAHVFRISKYAKEALENMELSVHGVAFGVTADEELIYTGYFWPGYSSASCNWICIDPLRLYQGNELTVELGYPGMIEGWEIPDKRNDPRILAIFRRDGKLVE